jgi:hypothetical protein
LGELNAGIIAFTLLQGNEVRVLTEHPATRLRYWAALIQLAGVKKAHLMVVETVLERRQIDRLARLQIIIQKALPLCLVHI